MTRGDVDLEALRAACDETVAGMMITVPNTLGLFEGHILEVIEAVHACGGLMYMDGANMNALMGVVKPGELGFDVMHYNLHKTFSTPHGGGGPGSGAVGVNDKLAPICRGRWLKSWKKPMKKTTRRSMGCACRKNPSDN